MKTLLVFILLYAFAPRGYAQMPEPRCIQSLCYDAAHEQILMYGGSGKDLYGDLWALKNNHWKKLSQAGPPPRLKSAFTFDDNRRCAVLFGGNSDNGILGDTWEWDGNNWKQINIPGPGLRLHCMAAYDAKNKQVILFGGINNGLLNDTWGYNGKQWIKLNADGPKDCIPHGMMYDEVKERVIMITLSANPDPENSHRKKNEMWEWSGTAWIKLAMSAPSTSEQGLQAVSSFGKNGIVLFDGDDVESNTGKTWVFDGTKWSGLRIPGPSPRYGHAVIFNKAQNKLVLFGGSNRKDNFYRDIWEWDGKKWNEIVASAG